MKRFYCTVCKKVKRVRKLPRLIESPSSTSVTDRVGMCNRHISIALPTSVRKVGAR